MYIDYITIYIYILYIIYFKLYLLMTILYDLDNNYIGS